jgi:hypothetical protein
MFDSGLRDSTKNSKSKSDFVLKLYLTKEQKKWVEHLSQLKQEPMSKCIANLIEAQRNGKNWEQKLGHILENLENLKVNQSKEHSSSASQLKIILSYLKEIFRESSANLYRINSIIDEFTDSETVRADVNEYVLKQESAMHTKALQIQEQNL